MMRPLAPLALASILMAAAVSASAAEGVRILALREADNPPAASVDQLAWLEGRWVGEGLGGQCEEIYGAPAGGRIMGSFGLVKDGTAQFYEFILITEHEGSLVLRLKHFGADFSPWEEADETVDFPLVAIDDDGAWFDGLTLERRGENGMVAAVRTSEGGAFEFHYRRASTID